MFLSSSTHWKCIRFSCSSLLQFTKQFSHSCISHFLFIYSIIYLLDYSFAPLFNFSCIMDTSTILFWIDNLFTRGVVVPQVTSLHWNQDSSNMGHLESRLNPNLPHTVFLSSDCWTYRFLGFLRAGGWVAHYSAIWYRLRNRVLYPVGVLIIWH